jgi:hypothetical protein
VDYWQLTEEETQRANEMGWEYGWDHANYVEAYGSEGVSKIHYPAQMDPDVTVDLFRAGRISPREQTKRFAMWRLFKVAFKEGQRRYRRGLNADGTPRETD